MTHRARVLVVDDQDLIRGSFRLLIDSDPDLAVVGEAGTGAEAVELATALRPDVVLMDIRMPGSDGITATHAICETTPDTRVIVLTMFDVDEYVYAALEAGASGFQLKNSAPEELLRAIRVVAAGDALLAPEVTRRLIADIARTRTRRPRSAPALTEREREVLTLIARGLSNDDITGELFLSRSTVKTYVSLASFALAQAGLGPYGSTLDEATVIWPALGAIVYWALIALLAFGLTVLVRDAVIPLVVLVSMSMALSLFLTKVTALAAYLPDIAGSQMFIRDSPTPGILSPVAGGAVMAAWTLALVSTGYLAFTRRDA